MKKKNIQYKGFSLIEMLLTMVIIMIVMLLVGTTLTTISKVSVTTTNKNLARSDINYMMDILSRTISNAGVEDIYLFDHDGRSIEENPVNGQLRIISSVPTGYDEGERIVDDGVPGNEIQVKIYGYDYWTCIGYFEDPTSNYGYVVKTTYKDDTIELDDNHSLCFTPTATLELLHSYSINTSSFTIEPFNVGQDLNSQYIVEVEVEPLLWPIAESYPINREIMRQAIMSTEALMMY